MEDDVYNTTLLFEWEYQVSGYRKRNEEHPRTITGRQQKFFKGTLTEIKTQMVETVRQQGRQQVAQWLDWEDKIQNETIKLFNIRQATLWSELEDF